MGKWKLGDYAYKDEYGIGIITEIIRFHTVQILFIQSGARLCFDNDLPIHFPLPIDPFNPERGLWGMVDWAKAYYNGFRTDYSNDWPSAIALLRALKEQIGGKK
jgi:hypothetical protein